VMCSDGTCAATYSDCNLNCTGGMIKCSTGCVNASSCKLPDWSYDVYAHFQFNNYYSNTGQFFATGPYLEKPDALALYFSFLVNKTQTYTVSLKSLTSKQIQSVGPHPYWTEEFDNSAITGAWQIIYQTSAPQSELTFDFAAAISSPEPVAYRNDSQHVKEAYCFAAPFLWYWDKTDLSEDSGLVGIPYIDEFRMVTRGYNINHLPPEVENITTPYLRWKCLTDPKFGWPFHLGITELSKKEKVLRYGIHIVVEKGVYALIHLPTKKIPSLATLPKMRDTNYAVLAVAAVVLFVLLLIVGYKVIVQKK